MATSLFLCLETLQGTAKWSSPILIFSVIDCWLGNDLLLINSIYICLIDFFPGRYIESVLYHCLKGQSNMLYCELVFSFAGADHGTAFSLGNMYLQFKATGDPFPL